MGQSQGSLCQVYGQEEDSLTGRFRELAGQSQQEDGSGSRRTRRIHQFVGWRLGKGSC